MPNEQTAKLSREQVQSVLNFAESLYIAEKYGSGYFSPCPRKNFSVGREK